MSISQTTMITQHVKSCLNAVLRQPTTKQHITGASTTIMNSNNPNSIRFQSSRVERNKSPQDSTTTSDNTQPPPYKHPQSFVKTRFTPGEANPVDKLENGNKADPLYRPPWKNRAKIISAEDFAARPRVTFNEQFDSMHDGMVVLSWMTEKERELIYDFYLQLMTDQASSSNNTSSNKKNGKGGNAGGGSKKKNQPVTSHEYVMRVIAQKFNITPYRAAAIVQNKHDEQMVIRHNNQKIKEGKEDELKFYSPKTQELVDAKIREHIQNAYRIYGEDDPQQFVEDPVGVNPAVHTDGGVEGQRVEDLYKDIDELMENAIVREREEAQITIDGMIYKEDVDDTELESKANSETLKLMKRNNEGFKELRETYKRKEELGELPLPTNGELGDDGEVPKRRKRWKYVAKTINTAEHKKHFSGKNRPRGTKAKQRKESKVAQNTLVEEDGVVRVATIAEVANTSWKPEKDGQECIYAGVKEAWLGRQLRDERDAWGKAPPPLEVVKPVDEDKVEEDDSNAAGDKDDAVDNEDTKSEESTEEKEDEDDIKK